MQTALLLGEARGNNRLKYIYDAAGNPTMLIYNGTSYYYITNQMGDVVQLRDTSGNTVASYTYDPYGALLSSSGNMAAINPLRYRGYYYDVESGLYYLNSRYYDPVTARFINADGYVSTGQGFTGLNMFAYCNNNPVNMEDSDGNRPLYSPTGDPKEEQKAQQAAREYYVSQGKNPLNSNYSFSSVSSNKPPCEKRGYVPPKRELKKARIKKEILVGSIKTGIYGFQYPMDIDKHMEEGIGMCNVQMVMGI